MLRLMLYDANNDTDLIEERKAAKDLFYDFNPITQLFSSALQGARQKRTIPPAILTKLTVAGISISALAC